MIALQGNHPRYQLLYRRHELPAQPLLELDEPRERRAIEPPDLRIVNAAL